MVTFHSYVNVYKRVTDFIDFKIMAGSGRRVWFAEACTGLDPKNDGRPQVRRFRPGLDYTVAARGAQDTDEASKKLEAVKDRGQQKWWKN